MVYEGNHRLGELFRSRREKGKPGLPTVSVTLTNGLVDRESLERKTDTNLAADEHLLVKKGDIAYNMMRMWQGACGLAEKDGIVSPAYVVLAPKKNVDSRYAAYLFKSQRLVYLFWAYSYGLTADRLRLYFADFAKIPVNVPSKEEQRAVARILSVWDKAIDNTEKLIANTKTYKRGLIQKLMNGARRKDVKNIGTRIRFGHFCLPVNEVCEPQEANKALRCIELEHIESGTGRLIGSTRPDLQVSLKTKFKKNDVLFGKLRPYLRKSWLADSDGYCSTEIWVFRANEKLCVPEFLQLICQTDQFAAACHITAGSKMPRAEWSVLSKTLFALPSMAEQERILRVTRNADTLLSCLYRKSQLLKSEKESLVQQLLTGKRRVKLDPVA